jgi:hypothetical protein
MFGLLKIMAMKGQTKASIRGDILAITPTTPEPDSTGGMMAMCTSLFVVGLHETHAMSGTPTPTPTRTRAANAPAPAPAPVPFPNSERISDDEDVPDAQQPVVQPPVASICLQGRTKGNFRAIGKASCSAS